MIHPVFYISQLEPATTSDILNHTNLPLPLIVVKGKLEYKIVQVLDAKLDCCHKPPFLYYVC